MRLAGRQPRCTEQVCYRTRGVSSGFFEQRRAHTTHTHTCVCANTIKVEEEVVRERVDGRVRGQDRVIGGMKLYIQHETVTVKLIICNTC